MQPPSVQSPFATSPVLPATRKTCVVSWESVTSPSLLLRAPAPILLPLLDFGLSLVREVYAGCHQPLLLTGPSRRYFANLSLVAWSPAPAVPSRACACYFPDVIGLPLVLTGRLPASFHERDFSWGNFSRLQTFLYVQAPKFARLPDRSHRCGYAAGRPRLLRPGRTCFVASARTGYACRPDRQLTAQGLAPC